LPPFDFEGGLRTRRCYIFHYIYTVYHALWFFSPTASEPSFRRHPRLYSSHSGLAPTQCHPNKQVLKRKQLLSHHDDGPPQEYLPLHTDSVLSLPPEYQQPPQEQPFCAERFGLPYLQNLASSAVSYCDTNSASSLTCFRTKIDSKNQRIDSFCIGGPATFDSKNFGLDCSLRQWSTEEAAQGIPRLEQFPIYWYGTGPSAIFRDYIRMNAVKESRRRASATPRNFSILIKREKSNYNVWHSLMEIFALYMTLDVLQLTPDPATKQPFFSTEDFANSQVVILDDLLDGPYFDLWTLFANQAPIRLQDVSDATRLNLENIIIPLPGAANPFWQGDWEPLPCDRSELLQTFARRVLDFYKIDDDLGPENRPLVLTFIDRTTKRRLIDQGLYIERLRARFPTVDIQVIDFAAMTFPEQLKIIRHTDILAGVHGAGLTHGMFLAPHSTIVEILPLGLKYKGFRNLANFLGHKYFSSHADEHHIDNAKGDWQSDDVFIEEDRFMELLAVAVKSMYNRGLRDEDVN
jgi:protein O-GlcNAc transferase